MKMKTQPTRISASASNNTHTLTWLMLLLGISTSTAFQVAPPVSTSHRTLSSSQLQYSATLNMPAPSHQPSFQDRMKKLVQEPKKIPQKIRPTLPNMFEASTLEEYKRIVVDGADDRVTVVRFHAPFCRTCKRVAPQFDKLARDHPDMNFVQVPFTKTESNRQLISGLGIKTVPYGHVYHPSGGLVEELKMTPRAFDDFEEIVESYGDESCDLPELDEDMEMYLSPYIRKH